MRVGVRVTGPAPSATLTSRAMLGLAWAVLAGAVAAGAQQLPAPEHPAAVRRHLSRAFVWPRTAPEEQGLDATVLERYATLVASGRYGEIDSLLVVRHGVLVFERYFNGWTADDLHRIYSVTKSIGSCLVGIARNEGALSDLDAPVLGFFPEVTPANLDDRKRRMRVADLLTMQSGMEWNELGLPYSDPRNPVSRLTASSDWVSFVLDQRMATEPGRVFNYCSGNSILLAEVLRRSVGVDGEVFAADRLFKPLGITSYVWDRGAPDVCNFGFGLHLRPSDLARIGLLVLQGGRWQGRQVVPAAWLDTATDRHATVDTLYTYGYQWWRIPFATASAGQPGYVMPFAWGFGSQFVFVIAPLDMVVVSTAGNFSQQSNGALEFVRSLVHEATIN